MSALTTRDALVRELRRHIGAHADIVANDLLASGAVIDAATLADVEALVEAVWVEAGTWASAEFIERGNLHPLFRDDVQPFLRALAVALTERGAQ